jgi:hypothetical protein
MVEGLYMAQEENEKTVKIYVEAREVVVDKHTKLSFRDIVILFFGEFIENPDVKYVVTYTNNTHDATHDMVDGGHAVEPKEGMSFNVSKSDKS